MPKRLEHLEAARLEAEKLGASIDFVHRTRHICGVIYYNNKTRKIFLSTSTKSGNVCEVVREDVRKKIREMSDGF
jgi:hypothetical protein